MALKTFRRFNMFLNLIDRSNYFKGLLILSRIDDAVSPEEKELLKFVGKSLQFSSEFCETTIDDIIYNKHVKNKPLKFSNIHGAQMFLRDALKLAFADSTLDKKEYEWLLDCARTNNIEDHWFSEQLELILNKKERHLFTELDIKKYEGKPFVLPRMTKSKIEN